MSRRLNVLSLARMELSQNRGTPIRVKSILKFLTQDTTLSVTVASWDSECPVNAENFFHLSNKHARDVWCVISFVRSHQVNLVIGHTLSSWFFLLAVRFLTRAKVMLEMHGFPEEEAKLYGGISMPRYFLEHYLYGLTYRACDLITTCSKTAAEYIAEYNPRTIPVYGGADLELFNPEVVPEEVRNEKRLRVGYVGNGRVWQGVPFLFKTYERFLRHDSDIELAVLLSEQKHIAIPTGVQVHASVPHDQAPRFLATCDVLVIPRLQNTVNHLSFPSKLIEYMAMGKSVIASKTSDAHRVITQEVDGILYEPEDSAALAAAIIKLKDPALRARIGRAAFETVRSSYTWEHQAGLIKTAIRSIFA